MDQDDSRSVQEPSSSGYGWDGMVIDYRMTQVAIQEKLSLTVNAYTWEIFATATSKLSKRKAVSSGGKVIKRDGSWRKCN